MGTELVVELKRSYKRLPRTDLAFFAQCTDDCVALIIELRVTNTGSQEVTLGGLGLFCKLSSTNSSGQITDHKFVALEVDRGKGETDTVWELSSDATQIVTLAFAVPGSQHEFTLRYWVPLLEPTALEFLIQPEPIQQHTLDLKSAENGRSAANARADEGELRTIDDAPLRALRGIQVVGYKNLQNITCPIGAFTVLAGPNGAGKSNLFDVLGLVRNLARYELPEAFEKHRGSPSECFERQMRVTLHLNISEIETPTANHTQGKNEFAHPSLEYVVDLKHVGENGARRTIISDESLTVFTRSGAIPADEDLPSHRRNVSIFLQAQDERHYPHTVTAARILKNMRVFHWELNALRAPVEETLGNGIEQNGEGLPYLFWEIEKTEPDTYVWLQRTVRRTLPFIQAIHAKLRAGDNKYALEVTLKSGKKVAGHLLSDGSLRLLALIALAYSKKLPTLVAIEEPENGIHPRLLYDVVELLRMISRRAQVLISTHSPYLVNLLEPDELVLVESQEDERGVTFTPAAERKAIIQLLEESGEGLGTVWSAGGLNGDL